MQVYLTKKLLNFAAKNPTLITQKTAEKVHVLNQTVPRFSHQFLNIPLKLFETLIDLGLEIFSLSRLIISSNLTEMLPLIISFLLVNLFWITLFYSFSWKFRHSNQSKKQNYQAQEKSQIKLFCENLNYPNNPVSLESIHNSLDKNSSKLSASFMLDEISELPDLIIPGIAVIFLFLYYQIWLGGAGPLGWDAYFVAYNLQRILWQANRMFYWSSQIPKFRENYGQIENFFS